MGFSCAGKFCSAHAHSGGPALKCSARRNQNILVVFLSFDSTASYALKVFNHQFSEVFAL